MKLISTNSVLVAQFSRLIRTYPNIAFAVAWASAGTPVFKQLLKRRARITKAVIGTHFYQTDPDVFDRFVGSKHVRFITQPTGVFHPKLYLFWNSSAWEALIGSANLTSGALRTNSEVVALIAGRDTRSDALRDKMLSIIEGYWSSARTATASTALAYRAVWERQQASLKRLSGRYGQRTSGKSPVDSAVMSMSWRRFLTAVKKDKYHGYLERCELLRLINAEFTRHRNFASMELGLRKTIAGLPTDYDKRSAWFGSMRGAGYFAEAVNDNNVHLSRALDHIPLVGQVDHSQYNGFLREFLKAFPKGRHGLATASRLLALKRPDQFVCVDAMNRKALCEDFGLSQAGINYDTYWSSIIARIVDSPWWNSPRPSNRQQQLVWDGRAAMLDAIFYRP